MDEMTLTLSRIAWLDGTILPDYYDVVFDGGIRDGKLHQPITSALVTGSPFWGGPHTGRILDLTLWRYPARAIARRLPPCIEHRAPPVAG
jgi:hypothetical protein